MKTALQLYTIRDCISDKNTLFTALEKVKALGYDGVEFAGFYGTPAEELKAKLNELSLTAVSCHMDTDVLKDFSEMLSYLQAIGCKAVALAWSDTTTENELQKTCGLLKNASLLAKQAGIELFYHNHDHEFNELEGYLPIDKIKEYCRLELDTFWSFVAGYDSPSYLKSNQSVIGLVHLKDGSKAQKTPCALGEGENDIEGIVKTAQQLGYEWIIVENDNPVPNGIEDVTRSINYLKSL